ncbi:TonB-dependent siderophore receptor (plasmid) [Thioclava litoralis]|uniref:TonB-dependent siderophore receptor n=1 Tax=Thioclava litoralis TaxID=3076557 RepID=A0ABZ1E5H7_9RHOB|nr:TonB-dependent siderophore receptor [Thioclava sp. FTW29]
MSRPCVPPPVRSALWGRLALVAPLFCAAPALAEEAVVALEEVVVRGEDLAHETRGYIAAGSLSASKTATALSLTPQVVSVVTAQQIADQGAQSVAQSLRYAPGILTEYRGTSNLTDETFVRGYSYVPRFLDGLAFGGSSFGQIDPWLLERVELLKGPSSALYGQSNPGGLIAMTSKRADGAHHGVVEARTGSGAHAGLAFDRGGALSQTLSWRVVGTGHRTQTQEEDGETQRYAVAPSLRWHPREGLTLDLAGLVQNEPDAGLRNFREAAGSLFPTATGALIPWAFNVSDPAWDSSTRTTKALSASLTQALGPQTTLRANARLSRIRTGFRSLVWGSLAEDGRTISRTASGGTEDLDQALVDLSVAHLAYPGGAEHRLLAGLDYRRSTRNYQWGFDYDAPPIDWTAPVYGYDSFDLNSRVSDTTTRATQAGLYVQDQIAFGRWQVTGGLRFDDFSSKITDHEAASRSRFSDQALTGRAAVLYAFDNGLSPYLSYATSFEPVTEASGSGTPFDPTQARQYELGVKWATPDGRYVAQAAYYDLRQTGVITYDSATYTPRQIGWIDSRGLEIEAQAEIDAHWSLLGSASWIEAEVADSARSSEIGKTPARMPERTAGLWGKYRAQAGYDIALGMRYIGRSQGDSGNTFEVPAVTLYDLALGYEFGPVLSAQDAMRLQLNVQNLADKAYVASCASAYACFVGNERTWTASLRYTF